MRSVNRLILTASVLLTVIQPAIAGAAANDGAAALSAESVERLKGIGSGESPITPTREDVPLVLRALQDRDLTISSSACLAGEKMAARKLFQPEDMKAIWEGLRPKMRDQHDNTSEWSARCVGALAQYTELLAGAFLNEAFDETILMVSSDGPEMQRRGAALSRDLVPLLPKDKLEILVRALLASPAATAEDGSTGNAEARCRGMVTAALIRAAPKIETPALANDVAVRLAILASSLTLEELEIAEKAIPPRTAIENPAEYASMYAAAKEALAARKLVLEQSAQQTAPTEEEVAFFEKKYQKQITGVKPKGEYSDPDQFYSAIAQQLGMPEIAWKAAAEKFGWKVDDGKVTKTMVKGGPTADGGPGTWDVLFLRFAVDPETEKPDPATFESRMVQIDYDGNITFPEIPKGNQ